MDLNNFLKMHPNLPYHMIYKIFSNVLNERVGAAGGNTNATAKQQAYTNLMKKTAYQASVTGRVVGRKDLDYILSTIVVLCGTYGIILPMLDIRRTNKITTHQSDEMCDIGIIYDDNIEAEKFKDRYAAIKDNYFYKIDEDLDYDSDDRTVGIIKYAAREGDSGENDVKSVGENRGFHITKG